MGHRAAALLADSRLTPAAVAAIHNLLEPGEDLAEISTSLGPGTDSFRSGPAQVTLQSGSPENHGIYSIYFLADLLVSVDRLFIYPFWVSACAFVLDFFTPVVDNFISIRSDPRDFRVRQPVRRHTVP